MRRPQGTGSLVWDEPRARWRVQIRLNDGTIKARFGHSRDHAEVLLEELLAEHKDRLGYHYYRTKPYYYVDRPATTKSRKLAPRIRFQILTRDGYRCRYCGAPAPEVRLQVDHILALVNGGTDDPENLVTACVDCNLGKGAWQGPDPVA